MHMLASFAGLALLAGLGSVPREASASSSANHLEVVFAYDPTFCGGCVASYTDTMELSFGEYGQYDCGNGDLWYFTEFTPILRSANCTMYFSGCIPGGACEITRVGYMTLGGNGPGTCPLWSIRKGDSESSPVADDQTFVISLAVRCWGGLITQKDCESDYVHFLDGANPEDASVVMAWDIQLCCNRCPN